MHTHSSYSLILWFSHSLLSSCSVTPSQLLWIRARSICSSGFSSRLYMYQDINDITFLLVLKVKRFTWHKIEIFNAQKLPNNDFKYTSYGLCYIYITIFKGKKKQIPIATQTLSDDVIYHVSISITNPRVHNVNPTLWSPNPNL